MARTSLLPPQTTDKPAPKRLVSIDAYRGLVMLAMASSGLAIKSTWERLSAKPEWLEQQTSGAVEAWKIASYQLSHVDWVGCGFWDMIQPSFMFLVGVAMPFSYARRAAQGDSGLRRFAHMLFRAIVLVGLGVFLQSKSQSQTNFIFTNVLAQIGLGYPFVYLLVGRNWKSQLAAIILILTGYWAFFVYAPIPETDTQNTIAYLAEQTEKADEKNKPKFDHEQFTGFAAHWNKHTNAGAYVDRQLLNHFPGSEEPWQEQRFWTNAGGYVTLNFIPSIATMLFGLMAGQLLRSNSSKKRKIGVLLGSGLCCFIIVLAADTTIWPIAVEGANWTVCPTVKKIWTPTWAVFSAGWAFWMLAGFYWFVDVLGFKKLVFPLAIVGMNSIAFYLMAGLIKGWVENQSGIHLTTLDILIRDACANIEALKSFSWEKGFMYYLRSDEFAWNLVARRAFAVFLLWLIALWMYRRKIFLRV